MLPRLWQGGENECSESADDTLIYTVAQLPPRCSRATGQPHLSYDSPYRGLQHDTFALFSFNYLRARSLHRRRLSSYRQRSMTINLYLDDQDLSLSTNNRYYRKFEIHLCPDKHFPEIQFPLWSHKIPIKLMFNHCSKMSWCQGIINDN